jgi:hypothetical protein
MLKCTVVTLVLSAALTAPAAWAQTQSPDPGARRGGQFITAQSSGQWLGSKLIGVDVYGPNDEKVGDIGEVLVDRSGNAHAVVIGVGGFLGIGKKDVALPFSALKWISHEEASKTARPGAARPATSGTPPADARADTKSTDAYQGYPHHAVISMTKEELKNAPEFRYASQADTPATAPSRPAREPAPAPQR